MLKDNRAPLVLPRFWFADKQEQQAGWFGCDKEKILAELKKTVEDLLHRAEHLEKNEERIRLEETVGETV